MRESVNQSVNRSPALSPAEMADRVWEGLDQYQQRIAKGLFTFLAQHEARLALPDTKPRQAQDLYIGNVACCLDLRWFELAAVVELYSGPLGLLKCEEDICAQSELGLADPKLIVHWPTLANWVAEAQAIENAKRKR